MEEIQESDNIANVDLDGTVADFDKALRQALEDMQSPAEGPLPVNLFDDPPAWLEARMDYIKNRPGFWRNLEVIPLGMAIVELLREAQYTLNILSKGPARAGIAWTEKFEWSRFHIPDALVTVTQDKGGYYGKVLVDDWPNYINGWLKWRKRGLVILPDRPYNQGYQHPNVIRVSGPDDFPMVREALIERRSR